MVPIRPVPKYPVTPAQFYGFVVVHFKVCIGTFLDGRLKDKKSYGCGKNV